MKKIFKKSIIALMVVLFCATISFASQSHNNQDPDGGAYRTKNTSGECRD